MLRECKYCGYGSDSLKEFTDIEINYENEVICLSCYHELYEVDQIKVTLKIYVYRGLVEKVEGMPEGYDYEIINKDVNP